MRIFGFLDQKRSKTIQILSQNFDCYGVIKGSSSRRSARTPPWFRWTGRHSARTACVVLVKKINKNPKIRIKLIYFYFEFSNKLFSMRIFIFLVFFFAFFYALKSVFNGDFIFSNFSFTKKMISTVFLIFFQYFGPIKIPR